MVRFVSHCCRARSPIVATGLFTLAAQSAHAITLDEIDVWVGSGDNRAGLVIDWGDGSSPVVYGYRFDGSVTGEDMFRAVATAQPELFLKTGAFSFGEFSGRSIFGVGLDRDTDGFAISDGSLFIDGIVETDTDHADGATATDPDDSYAEGWRSAYWSYYTSDGTTDWGFADAGFTDRLLSDGQWDGWAYQPGFIGNAPGVSVPEPGSMALVLGGGLALLRRRR